MIKGNPDISNEDSILMQNLYDSQGGLPGLYSYDFVSMLRERVYFEWWQTRVSNLYRRDDR